MPPVTTSLLLGGRYEIGSLVATGGMGEIWEAHDRLLERVVAVKALRPGFLPDPAAAERLRSEARAAARLSSDRVVRVFDAGDHVDEDGRSWPYLVMELVPGCSLSELLREQTALTPAAAERLLRQVAEALSSAHAAGLVHRDVKPANLLVLPSGDVKVTDFGISQHDGIAGLTATGLLVGTARYLSPEQVSGERATAASDIYSLGVVLHESLSGRPLFAGESDVSVALAHVQQSPGALPQDVPLRLAGLVMSMLHKDPGSRPTADGVLQALDRQPAPVAATARTTATLPLVLTTNRPTARRHRRRTTAALVLAGGTGVALVLGASHGERSPLLPSQSQPSSSSSRDVTVTPQGTAVVPAAHVTVTHAPAAAVVPRPAPVTHAPAKKVKHGKGKGRSES